MRQPQIVFHGQQYVTEENHESIITVLTNLCLHLQGAERDITNYNVIVPVARELYINMAKTHYLSVGQPEKAEQVWEEGKENTSLLALLLEDEMHNPTTGEVTSHSALVIGVVDEAPDTVKEGAVPKEELEQMKLKGFVLVSFDEIMPVHFMHLLQARTNNCIGKEGVATVVLAQESGDVSVYPLTHEDALNQINEYRKLLLNKKSN